MVSIQELLSNSKFLILDGAMGTLLMDAGLEQGDPGEAWNVLHPEKIRAVHRAYVEAGSNVILTNSFGGTHFRLAMHGYQDKVYEFNLAAAKNAREVADMAGHPVLVAGSIGPSGELFFPLGTVTFEEARDAFAEQAAALAEGGADLIWIETMSALEEVQAAVEGVRSVTDLPITVTMTFDTNGHTMMGVSPQKAAEALKAMGLAAVGANCGNGPQEIESVVETFNDAGLNIPLIAKSNAGLPHFHEGEFVYDGTPEVMAAYAERVYKLGASLIGGCCGNTPEHIRAMRSSLETP